MHTYCNAVAENYKLPVNMIDDLWKDLIDNSTENNKSKEQINYGIIICLLKKRLNRWFNLDETVMGGNRPEFDLFVSEKNILTKERDQIKNIDFGLSDVRKFPLNTKDNLIFSMILFDNCDENRKPELAHRIMIKSKELSVPVVNPEIRKYE